VGDQVARAIALAKSKLGAPYVWATAGPDTFDCSGFMWWIACRVLGPQEYELRSSHHEFNVWGEPVERGDLRAGDLAFFDVGQGVIMGNRAGHVVLMLDDTRFIHAANEQDGVIVSELWGDWYRPRFIGARRIYDAGDGVMGSSGDGEYRARRLVVPEGPMRTPTPWNGEPFGAGWSSIGRWAAPLEDAARERDLDVRLPAVVMAIETQGIHVRDGRVLEIWDGHAEDGPSVGLMQVKPRVWQWLMPEADPYEPEGNIRLGVAVLAHAIAERGTFFRAIAEVYHPGVAPNGTTPARYVEAARGRLKELGYGGDGVMG
jgi:hypothetical protein